MKKKQLLSIFAAFALAGQTAMAATHTAQKGDTFWIISQKYGVSLSDLLKANNATENTVLNIGDVVTIPGSGTTHVVQKGDTFWIISQKYGVSLSDLLKANNATESTVLNIGDVVTIPGSGTTHVVQKGDTFWIISQKYGVSLSDLLKANNATESTVLNIGDTVIIPASSSASSTYTAKSGDSFWSISQKYGVSLSALLKANNATESTVLNIGDVVTIPSGGSSSGTGSSTSSGAYITYTSYTVKSGDTLWDIAIKCGIPLSELLEANSLTESSSIKVGQVLTVPVHNVPVKETVSSKYGELLDWWTEAQYVIPINAVFTVQDLATGKSFNAKRTIGSNHADCEPLTANDTAVMKEIWGGSWSWDKRPVLIIYNGRKIAASAAGMPHAGNEWAEGGVWTDWRSDNYGAGINYDYVKGNDFSGHFDIHFYNSTTHNTGTVSAAHQANVMTAAGLS